MIKNLMKKKLCFMDICIPVLFLAVAVLLFVFKDKITGFVEDKLEEKFGQLTTWQIGEIGFASLIVILFISYWVWSGIIAKNSNKLLGALLLRTR